MKKIYVFGVILTFCLTASTAVNARTEDAPPAARAIRIAPPAPKFSDAERLAELAKRRNAVAARMGASGVMVLFSAEPKLYTNDVDYEYRQENNLYYLTALKQKGATLVLMPGNADAPEVLFLPKRNPMMEAWEGKMYSQEQARKISGVQTVLDAEDFAPFVAALKDGKSFDKVKGLEKIAALNTPRKLFLLQPVDTDTREYVQEINFAAAWKNQSAFKVENAQYIFWDLRSVKSPYELKILQHSIDITTEAFGRSMAVAGRSKFEYEVEAEVEYTFRKRNAAYWGYPSIVGCGPNATTLHYNESQGEILPNSLLLMDVGAEYDHYTADVTRTFPVNGKFTKEQAEIYQIVFDAQEAVARATKPGATLMDVNSAALAVQAEGLAKLGLLPDKNSPFVKTWTLHGTSHWLGMNVHDVGAYNMPFKPGFVFTNEPGIYIREDALDNLPNTPEANKFKEFVRPAFEKYKNIGVRIEDDLLVTATGADWMTKNLPRTIADIEAIIARASKELPPEATATNFEPRQRIFFDYNAAEPFSFFGNQTATSGKTMRGGFAFVGTAQGYAKFNHHAVR
jgi:Xaa-Pro aminopeptidase